VIGIAGSDEQTWKKEQVPSSAKEEHVYLIIQRNLFIRQLYLVPC